MWVSAAGSILVMKKVATEVQTSQAHMNASIQPRSHPLSVVLDPGAMNATVHKVLTSTQQSCPRAERSWSAWSVSATSKTLLLRSLPPSLLIALFLSSSDAHPYFHFTALSPSSTLSL
ncbi:hypothetical protein CgunFtcFv8_025136 [Champsocephalus gunnari]|uniref:Uncharacterized protein n=1 Tax=Champsocephalus gunnari TaxID=52237 RepID=A0AAN8DGK3_CHAGU|nr:hypothetical protein CgunFtcFv8_025136 [Champsocephalus gunnari]